MNKHRRIKRQKFSLKPGKMKSREEMGIKVTEEEERNWNQKETNGTMQKSQRPANEKK